MAIRRNFDSRLWLLGQFLPIMAIRRKPLYRGNVYNDDTFLGSCRPAIFNFVVVQFFRKKIDVVHFGKKNGAVVQFSCRPYIRPRGGPRLYFKPRCRFLQNFNVRNFDFFIFRFGFFSVWFLLDTRPMLQPVTLFRFYDW